MGAGAQPARRGPPSAAGRSTPTPAASRARYANETTPCFDIKGTIILNFDLPKVEKALGLA